MTSATTVAAGIRDCGGTPPAPNRSATTSLRAVRCRHLRRRLRPTLVASGGSINMRGLWVPRPVRPCAAPVRATGPELVLLRRWWTILSASWIHGGALHIVLNMMAVRQLAPAVAELYGPGRMVIIYTAGGVAGFAFSVFWGLFMPAIPLLGSGRGITIGASACITGLLGAIYYYGHRGGSSMARSYGRARYDGSAARDLPARHHQHYAHSAGLAEATCRGVLDPLRRARRPLAHRPPLLALSIGRSRAPS